MREKINYIVAKYQDDIYEVLNRDTYESYFQGSLSECDAWIRLQEGGYF